MSEPLKCRFCGAGANDVDGLIFANCGTWVYTYDNTISRSTRCERDALLKRIEAAIYRAELAIQFGPTIDNALACVFECDVADVVKILRGNSPIISDGSRGSDE